MISDAKSGVSGSGRQQLGAGIFKRGKEDFSENSSQWI
jgi:hypothetical protein